MVRYDNALYELENICILDDAAVEDSKDQFIIGLDIDGLVKRLAGLQNHDFAKHRAPHLDGEGQAKKMEEDFRTAGLDILADLVGLVRLRVTGVAHDEALVGAVHSIVEEANHGIN